MAKDWAAAVPAGPLLLAPAGPTATRAAWAAKPWSGGAVDPARFVAGKGHAGQEPGKPAVAPQDRVTELNFGSASKN